MTTVQSRAQSCKKLKRSELIHKCEDATTLEGFLNALPGGGARRKILSLVFVHFLPLYSQVQTVLSGVFKEEVFFTESNEKVNIRQILLLEKNKMICRFRKVSTTYIRNIGSVGGTRPSNQPTPREFYETTDLVDLIRVPLKQHFDNPPAHYPRVARLCYGTPLSLACKKGDVNMVHTILQFRTLWGEAWGVRLKTGDDVVNVAAMPLKSCMDVIGTAAGEFYTGGDILLRATRNELFATPDIDSVRNWRGGATMWERKNPFLPVSETLNIILSHAFRYPVNGRVFSKVEDTFFQSITDRHFTILRMLMENGAQVTYLHIEELCSLTKNGYRLQQFISQFGSSSGNSNMEKNMALWKLASEYRTRVLNILLPYVPDGAKLKMLEGLIKVIVDTPKTIAIDLFCEISSTHGYMANVRQILSDNPKLSTVEFSRVQTHGNGAPISALIDMFVKEGVVPIDSEKKTSNNGRRKMFFPYLLELFHVLLSYKKWSSNPGAIHVPGWVLQPKLQSETCPWTVTDIFYLAYGRWHESCQRMYLERLHPLILELKGMSDDRGGIIVGNHVYLTEILKEEVHWREGGDVLIKERKEAFMMKLWEDKLKFLEEEGKRVRGKMERGVSWVDDDAEIVKFFPDNKLRRSYGIRLSSSETFQCDDPNDLWPSRRTEFQVSFSESSQRNKQKKEIQEAEKHFESVRCTFRIKKWERKDFKRLFPHFEPGDETVEWYAIFGELFLHSIPRWKENKLLKEYFTTHITTRSLYGVDSQTNSSSSQ